MRADSFNYAVHHFVWRPQPGKMIDVEGAAPVPALTAELEYVPLWYFENTTGTLRFLPYGGFGVIGAEMDFENEWMVTTGRGLMFAAAICYVFKRLTFQDWTIFNERYAQNKVVGMTNATKESSQGQALLQVIADFNGDQGIAFFECGNTDKPPIQLLGPQGAVTAEIFEKFIERQDRKIASMFRGNDLSMMSRGGKGERAAGASLQKDEGDAMERGACKMIAGALHEGIDRKVIRYCFGEDVEPLAYFGLPDMDVENTKDLRESAGFLADRGAKVAIENVADRLGVQLATDQEEALQPVQSGANTESLPVETQTANAQIESEAVALLRTVEEALRTANGDVPGHEFHGNQWSGGGVTEGHVKLSGSKVIKESDKAVLTHVQLKEGSTELWLPKSHASVDESGTVHASPWIIDQKERGFDESHNPDLRGESIRTGDHTERPKMSHEEQTRMLKDNTDRNARNEAARDKAAEKREAGKGEKEARIARARVDQIKSTHLPSAQKELERVAANPSATKALGRAQSRIDDLKGEMERLTKQHAL